MKQIKSDLSEYLTDELDEELMCSICKGLLHKPVQCENGHMHCADCLARCSSCPICRAHIGSPSRALFVEKVIGQKKIYCKYRLDVEGLNVDSDGCQATFCIEQREAHLSSCKHRWVACENSSCNARMRFMHQEVHHATCPWRIVARCVHCGNAEQTYIHTMSCPREVIPCSLGCPAEIERCQVKKHKLTCTMVRVLCTFARVGCRHRCIRADLQQHCEQYAAQHVQLLMDYVQVLESGGGGGVAGGLEHRLIWRIADFDPQSTGFHRSKSFAPQSCPFRFYLGMWPRGASGTESQHPALSPSRAFRNIVFPLKVGMGWGEEKILRSAMITRENGFLDESGALIVNAILNVTSITLEL